MRGISIPPDMNTFYVPLFDVTAPNVIPTLARTFTERLKDKVRNESRLRYTETDPDIEFLGEITRYESNAVAPEPGETTAFNRLDVSVAISFVNYKNEDENWNQTFSYFSDYPSTQNLIAIQDDLLEDINEQLVEDIFNKAFTNW